jgi:hypothetical protein
MAKQAGPHVKALEIPPRWHEDLPIFAHPAFLSAVSDRNGWLGGIDEHGELRCILPYTVIRRGPLSMARFRVETLPQGGELTLPQERSFLRSVIKHCRAIGADMVIPATTNTVFRTYPEGADAAPYGTYRADLTRHEDELWGRMRPVIRSDIKRAMSAGVKVVDGSHELPSVYSLVRDTFRRSRLPFMSWQAFERYVVGLGAHAKVMLACLDGRIQSCALFAFSRYCAYAPYVGNVDPPMQGANKLLYWEAMRHFRQAQVRCFDLVGARIKPDQGSKHDGINALKRRLGGSLTQGYIWKYPLSPLKYRLYSAAVRWRSGGDIVDAERHKLQPAFEQGG